MLQRLKEVHPTLDITALEEGFGGPTRGRLNIAAAEEATEAPQEAEVGGHSVSR